LPAKAEYARLSAKKEKGSLIDTVIRLIVYKPGKQVIMYRDQAQPQDARLMGQRKERRHKQRLKAQHEVL